MVALADLSQYFSDSPLQLRLHPVVLTDTALKENIKCWEGARYRRIKTPNFT